jgi:hypothetical protein
MSSGDERGCENVFRVQHADDGRHHQSGAGVDAVENLGMRNRSKAF